MTTTPTIRVPLAGMDAYLSIFGANGRNLSLLEGELGVKLSVRGADLEISGGEEDAVRRAVGLLRSGLDAAVKKPPYDDMGLELIGPAPAPVVRINGSYRYRLLLLGENNAQVRGLLSSFMRAFAQRAENRRLHIRVDCDLMD